jgi:hypothetical protein
MKQQQSAIADPQFGTSFFQYRYRLLPPRPIDKDIELTMFQIADWRLLIARSLRSY